MICKCPNCDGAIKYNPSLSKMECPFCATVFEVQKDRNIKPEEVQAEVKVQDDEDTVSCRIYACTACGAEVAVSDTEVSTYCGYCGQPTIIFRRVSNEKKPKYIIPFKINKEQAVEKIREKIEKGSFVPKEIKNFEVERVRGIYVPYRIYNIHYYDKQKLKGQSKHSSNTLYFLKEAECEFVGITSDASKRLDDKMMDWLEPYDFKELVPFDVRYLSGFYADKDDVDENALLMNAVKRVKELFDEEIKSKTNADYVKICESNGKYKLRQTDYIMLPVWFLNFKYKNTFYTILVNGQTGKVVGAVPAAFGKRLKYFAITALITTVISVALCLLGYWLTLNSEDTEEFIAAMVTCVLPAIISIFSLVEGWKTSAGVKKQIKKTKNKTTEAFVRKRQEGNE